MANMHLDSLRILPLHPFSATPVEAAGVWTSRARTDEIMAGLVVRTSASNVLVAVIQIVCDQDLVACLDVDESIDVRLSTTSIRIGSPELIGARRNG